jgi:cytochrome c553
MKMKYVLGILLLVPFSVTAQNQQQRPKVPSGLEWAYNTPDKDQPAEDDALRHVPGSSKSYTQAQIDDLHNPPDWFPEDHGPLPSIIEHGSGQRVFACGSCHLMSGLGHPESADLAGLPSQYLAQQMADFKSGARKGFMDTLAANMSDEEVKTVVDFYSSLKPRHWIKVIETDTVPKTYISKHLMRLPVAGGETEPIGNRIIETPEDPALGSARDARGDFIAYVPKGSIAKGQELVTNGIGSSGMGCTMCHGFSLEGQGAVPRLAGMSPSYAVRQFVSFQDGTRSGTSAEVMKGALTGITTEQMIAITAYLASLPPK